MEILLIVRWEDVTTASPTPDIALTDIIDITNQSACTCIPFRIIESKKAASLDAKLWSNQNLKK